MSLKASGETHRLPMQGSLFANPRGGGSLHTRYSKPVLARQHDLHALNAGMLAACKVHGVQGETPLVPIHRFEYLPLLILW